MAAQEKVVAVVMVGTETRLVLAWEVKYPAPDEGGAVYYTFLREVGDCPECEGTGHGVLLGVHQEHDGDKEGVYAKCEACHGTGVESDEIECNAAGVPLDELPEAEG